MQVSKIQSTVLRQQCQPKLNRTTNLLNKPEQEPVAAPAFKGAKGGLWGLGGGLVTGLIVVCGGLITGGLAIPALLGGAAVLGSGAAGAALGNKVENKLFGPDKK